MLYEVPVTIKTAFGVTKQIFLLVAASDHATAKELGQARAKSREDVIKAWPSGYAREVTYA